MASSSLGPGIPVCDIKGFIQQANAQGAAAFQISSKSPKAGRLDRYKGPKDAAIEFGNSRQYQFFCNSDCLIADRQVRPFRKYSYAAASFVFFVYCRCVTFGQGDLMAPLQQKNLDCTELSVNGPRGVVATQKKER